MTNEHLSQIYDKYFKSKEQTALISIIKYKLTESFFFKSFSWTIEKCNRHTNNYHRNYNTKDKPINLIVILAHFIF
jgi:hypothetical protein